MGNGTLSKIFALKEKKYIKEASSEVYLYEHIKTGAKLLYMKNDDDNKVFSISFATYPNNSCGTAHIIEHSVLCGSESYPLKDPFVKLLASSLNTFLNAMTFSDKTMYPVASQNEDDFSNLIDVYCDAVFNPLIKKDPFAFLQEGWHYENSGDGLKINGIVYNEMKGVYSDPEEILSELSASSLFPDTIYSHDSGGNPEVIPKLSYEKFMEFYNMHYTPSNSFIFIYGDTDIEKHMLQLDEKYLSRYSFISPPEAVLSQPAFDKPAFLNESYSVDNEQDEEDGFYFSQNYKLAEAGQMNDVYALNVLTKMLFDMDSSVMKKALTDADFAQEIVGDYTTCVKQPYFTIAAKNATKGTLDKFTKVISETFDKIMTSGFSEKIITAAINSLDFELREADSGQYPKGVIYNIHVMESWLYSESPFEQLEYEKYMSYLKENANSAFYTNLIKKYFIDNTHVSTVMLSPVAGLNERREEDEKRELAKYEASLTKEQLEDIKKTTAELNARQNMPDSPEAIKTIPVLPISAISEKPQWLDIEQEDYKGAKIYTYCDKCSDIFYADFGFALPFLSEKELSAIELLSEIIGIYATEKNSEEELAAQSGIYLGDTDLNINTHQSIIDVNSYEKRMVYFSKALVSNADKLFDITAEVLLNTRFDDARRLYKTICEQISKYEGELISSSENYAAIKVAACFTKKGAFRQRTKAENYYSFLLTTKTELEAGNDSALDMLKNLTKKLVNSFKMDILITCDKENEHMLRQKAAQFIDKMPCRENEPEFISPKIRELKHEGIIIPSNVCYTAIGANLKTLGIDMPKTFSVCRKFLRTGYLWENIRVKGGAYGAIFSADRGGDVVFVSYRDPNVAETYDIYRRLPEYVAEVKLSEKEINDIIIGTISDIDMPQPVYTKGRRALYNIYRGLSFETESEIRSAILSATNQSINECAPSLEAIMQKGARCALAPEGKLKKAESDFDIIYSIKQAAKK